MTRGEQTLDLLDAHIGVFNIRNLRRVDWGVVSLVLALVVLGLLTLNSASRGGSAASDDAVRYDVRQAMAFLMGVGIVMCLVCVDYRFLVSLAPIAYAASVLLLVLVLLFGAEVNNCKRWLDIGGLRLQPSELAKPALVYMLAWYMSTVGERLKRAPWFLLALVIAGTPMLLIQQQPSLGTAVSLAPVPIAMLFAAGCKKRHLAALLVLGVAAAPVVWHTQLSEYQKDRLRGFADRNAKPVASAWQTTQAKITVGSGGMTGKGFRKGIQTQLSYVPEHHTDFVFAVLAEEGGFVASACVVGLFAMLFLRGLALGAACPDMSGTLLAVGCVTVLAFHAFVNVAITIGMLPVTGLPLPFFSYGRSFYLAAMVCVGAILSVHVRKGLFDE